MIPSLLLSSTAYNCSQKIPSDHCHSKKFCCLLRCHHLPLFEPSHAICSGHLCRPDLFSYKEGNPYKAEPGALVGRENNTICFCWFVAQILLECLHLLLWYLNFPLLTVKQRPGVKSTVCCSEGWNQPRHTWMLTSLPLDSQASALVLNFQLGICSSHFAVLTAMSFTLVCK